MSGSSSIRRSHLPREPSAGSTLGSDPASVVNPAYLAEAATEIGKSAETLKTRVIDKRGLERHGMGMIIRCPDCDAVLMRVAHVNGYYWLDMRGVASLQLADL